MSTPSGNTGWMDRAACKSRPDLGWLAEPEDVGFGEEATMAVVCQRCPVLGRCGDYAERTEVTGGFWAGHHRTPSGPLLPVRGDAA